MIHIWRPLWRGCSGYGKNEMLSDVGACGVSECSGCSIFVFFIKENWICAMTRHHAEPNINISLTRNLPFDSDVSQRSHPLMISLHCLWTKSNNRAWSISMWRDLVSFLFWFRSFTCTVWLLFYSLFTFSSRANKTGWLQNEY